MLDSEQAMHLWAKAKFLQNSWFARQTPPEDHQPFADALQQLTELRPRLFRHYQRLVESEDKNRLAHAHQKNLHLECIVSEFVAWYCAEGHLQRVNVLLDAARCITQYSCRYSMLSQLHVEMVRLHRTDTFEAVRLYNEFKRCALTWENKRNRVDRLMIILGELKAPDCVRQLLRLSDGQQVQKFNSGLKN